MKDQSSGSPMPFVDVVSDAFVTAFGADTVHVYVDPLGRHATVRRVGESPLPLFVAFVTPPDRVVLMLDNYDVEASDWQSALLALAAPRLVQADKRSFTLAGSGGSVRCVYSGEDSIAGTETAEWLACLDRA